MSSLCRASTPLTKSGQRLGAGWKAIYKTVPGTENGLFQPVKSLAMKTVWLSQGGLELTEICPSMPS